MQWLVADLMPLRRLHRIVRPGALPQKHESTGHRPLGIKEQCDQIYSSFGCGTGGQRRLFAPAPSFAAGRAACAASPGPGARGGFLALPGLFRSHQNRERMAASLPGSRPERPTLNFRHVTFGTSVTFLPQATIRPVLCRRSRSFTMPARRCCLPMISTKFCSKF